MKIFAQKITENVQTGNTFIMMIYKMLETIYLLVGAFVSEIAGTIAGFGSSSIFLPIASEFLNFKTALLLVAIYHIFGNVSRFSMFYKHRNAKIFRLFGLPSVIATILGASLAGIADPNTLKFILGIILFSFALYSLIRPVLIATENPWRGRIGGACSGFTAGLIGTGGVLRGAFMSLFKLSKEEYIATIASIALLVDFTRIPIYFGQGFLEKQYLRMIPVLLCIAFIGSRTGKWIVQKIPQETFRKIILVCVMIVSIYLVFQNIHIFF